MKAFRTAAWLWLFYALGFASHAQWVTP